MDNKKTVKRIGPPMNATALRACVRWFPHLTVRQLFTRRDQLGGYVVVRGQHV